MVRRIMFLNAVLLIGVLGVSNATPLKFFGGVDLFTLEGAADNWDENVKNNTRGLTDRFGESHYTTQAQAGQGYRVGLLMPVKQYPKLNIGFSYGRIFGPSYEFHVLSEGYYFPQTVDGEIDTNFDRYMTEVVYCIAEKKGGSLNLGIAIGYASGRIEETDRYGGNVLGGLGTRKFSKDWDGVSYEVTPSLFLGSGKLQAQFGFRYSIFPTLHKTDGWSEFSWRPFGFFIGVMVR